MCRFDRLRALVENTGIRRWPWQERDPGHEDPCVIEDTDGTALLRYEEASEAQVDLVLEAVQQLPALLDELDRLRAEKGAE